MNKKGAEMTIGTIIAIALGVALLVLLVWGTTQGWGQLWDRVTQIGGGDSNVDSVVSGCQVACNANSEYAYCDEVRTVRFGDGETAKGSCDYLTSNQSIPVNAPCPGLC